jgi:hypothetical protein
LTGSFLHEEDTSGEGKRIMRVMCAFPPGMLVPGTYTGMGRRSDFPFKIAGE